MKRILLSFTLLVLVACSGGKQDPLEDQPQRIRDGLPPEKVVDTTPKSLARDVLIIEMWNVDGERKHFINVDEDQELVIRINGRITDLDESLDLEFLNPPRGSTITETQGSERKSIIKEFRWTPTREVMKNNQFINKYDLQVRLRTVGRKTEKTDQPIVKTVSFPIWLHRKVHKPEIVKVDGFKSQITEGDLYKFTVRVQDYSASYTQGKSNFTLSRVPTLTFFKTSSSFDLGSVLASIVSGPSKVGDFVWEFEVELDATAEITPKERKFSLGLVVVSTKGVPSFVKDLEFTVRTNIELPIQTWSQTSQVQQVREGDHHKFVFFAFDKKNEGDIEVNLISSLLDLPGKTRFSCKNSLGVIRGQSCELSWRPEKLTTNKVHELKYEVKNIGPFGNVKTDIVTKRFEVLALTPDPQTTVAPGPTTFPKADATPKPTAAPESNTGASENRGER